MKSFNLNLAQLGVFIAAMMVLFSGCTEEKYYVTNCEHDYAAMDTYYFPVEPYQWREAPGPDGPYFYATFPLPEITGNVIERGVVLAYFIENERDNILPYLRPWRIDNYIFFQNIRFDIERGQITFIVEASDFEFPEEIIGDMEFKVVVMQNFRH